MVWAGGSQVWTGQRGTLIPRPTTSSAATSTWVGVDRPAPWAAASRPRSEVPLWTTSTRIPSSIRVDPSAVKSTNRLEASARARSVAWSSPNRLMSTHIGTRTTSNATKKRIASRAKKVASAPNSTSRRQA